MGPSSVVSTSVSWLFSAWTALVDAGGMQFAHISSQHERHFEMWVPDHQLSCPTSNDSQPGQPMNYCKKLILSND